MSRCTSVVWLLSVTFYVGVQAAGCEGSSLYRRWKSLAAVPYERLEVWAEALNEYRIAGKTDEIDRFFLAPQFQLVTFRDIFFSKKKALSLEDVLDGGIRSLIKDQPQLLPHWPELLRFAPFSQSVAQATKPSWAPRPYGESETQEALHEWVGSYTSGFFQSVLKFKWLSNTNTMEITAEGWDSWNSRRLLAVMNNRLHEHYPSCYEFTFSPRPPATPPGGKLADISSITLHNEDAAWYLLRDILRLDKDKAFRRQALVRAGY